MTAFTHDPSLALQQAIFAALTADADVAAFFVPAQPRVYDHVPTGRDGKITATFPYFTIGDDQVIGHTNQAIDPSEIFAKIEVWDRTATGSRLLLKGLVGAARAALCVNLQLAGHSVITNAFHGALYRREADGVTDRAILTIRYLTQPSTPTQPPYV